MWYHESITHCRIGIITGGDGGGGAGGVYGESPAELNTDTYWL